MALVHVVPREDEIEHNTDGGGAACWCEPKILDFGLDSEGQPARVFVHQDLKALRAVVAQEA